MRGLSTDSDALREKETEGRAIDIPIEHPLREPFKRGTERSEKGGYGGSLQTTQGKCVRKHVDARRAPPSSFNEGGAAGQRVAAL